MHVPRLCIMRVCEFGLDIDRQNIAKRNRKLSALMYARVAVRFCAPLFARQRVHAFACTTVLYFYDYNRSYVHGCVAHTRAYAFISDVCVCDFE